MFLFYRPVVRSLRAASAAGTQLHARGLHQSSRLQQQSQSTAPAPNPRWVSNLKKELRKVPNHEELLEEVTNSAVELMLGVEGFGTKPFHVEPVTWGDMDAMVR